MKKKNNIIREKSLTEQKFSGTKGEMEETLDLERQQLEDEDEQRRRRQKRRAALRKKRRRRRNFTVAAVIFLAVIAGVGMYLGARNKKREESSVTAPLPDQTAAVQQGQTADLQKNENGEQKGETGQESGAQTETVEDILSQAAFMAAQYDYDKAIRLLKGNPEYDSSEELKNAAAKYEEEKAACVSWPLEEVTHVFYHTLIKDTSKAFDGDYKEADYNQVMTTIDEFNRITQIMYEKGYVLVNIYDMGNVDGDGNMSRGEILLPPGKIPFVLSQDDVSYYHYMDGDGYATKLIVDDEGKVRNEYVEADGSITVGDYDMVPLIDRFVEEHPDFSYRGAKGIIALTGYNGILGYRTDESYQTRPDDLDQNKVDWLNANPEFDLEKERAGAKKVADAMRAGGWLFASHTWGHQNIAQISLEKLMTDTTKFKNNVDPLIGGTDIIIFAFGTDLSDFEDYSGEKFDYLKSQGYHYFCNVDSSRYFVQIRDNYFRMGRRNLDGYRMYYHPEMVSDLFDVKDVWDASRPTPVAQMS